jgi:dihydropteroate synthase
VVVVIGIVLHGNGLSFSSDDFSTVRCPFRVFSGAASYNAHLSPSVCFLMTLAERLQSAKPLLMGILNATPDSFSDGGLFLDTECALQQALTMVGQGADIIDVGGESTRPGALPVDAVTQIARVVPVISALRDQVSPETLISIDTTQATVAAAALDAGANFINDVSAGLDDPAMLALAAQRGVAIVLMHRQGTSLTMQDNPFYHDVVAEASAFLLERAAAARAVGIAAENIILDPGIGFGKRREDNLVLMANLAYFAHLGYATLLGASRKRFMGAICHETRPQALVAATVATTTLGVMAGINIFRVHDLRENRQAADVAFAIKQAA